MADLHVRDMYCNLTYSERPERPAMKPTISTIEAPALVIRPGVFAAYRRRKSKATITAHKTQLRHLERLYNLPPDALQQEAAWHGVTDIIIDDARQALLDEGARGPKRKSVCQHVPRLRANGVRGGRDRPGRSQAHRGTGEARHPRRSAAPLTTTAKRHACLAPGAPGALSRKQTS